MKLFDQTRPATLEDVSWLRKAVRRQFEGLNIASDLSNEFVLAIAELATNIVAHAASPATSIRLCVELVGSSLRLTLEDDGAPFAEFQTAWMAAERKELKATDVHGLGLALAHESLSEVSYAPGPPNALTASRPIVRSRPTVLILEDDATLLMLYKVLLSRTCRVLSAANVETALALARTHTVDLILSDYYIKGGNGTNLLAALEADAGRLPIPIIMMSSDDQLAVRTHAYSFGIEAFLIKPIKPANLVLAVEQGLASANRRLTGLFRYFGASTEKLLEPPVDNVLLDLGIGLRWGATNFGGGDFVLRFPMPNRERIILTDMMGHGLQSKIASIALASAMRTLQANQPPSPGAFLTALSGIVSSDPALSGLMATAIVVDRLDGGVFHMATSAHPSPMAVSSKGVRQIAVGGPILGFLPAYKFTDVAVTLQPGERMLLVTDGIDPMVVASGGSLPAELAALLTSVAAETLPFAIEATERWANAALGPHPRDDWTLMLLEPSRASA
ncbi:MAG: hypothetical protein RL291_635 [Pseudomonadota bacterium]